MTGRADESIDRRAVWLIGVRAAARRSEGRCCALHSDASLHNMQAGMQRVGEVFDLQPLSSRSRLCGGIRRRTGAVIVADLLHNPAV
jgi:hypothetical protein